MPIRESEEWCEQCKKDLPFTEFFHNRKKCVDCMAANNDGKIYCQSHKGWTLPSKFSLFTKRGNRTYRSAICSDCTGHHDSVEKAGRKRKAANKVKECKACGGGPTEQDKEYNGGRLTNGLCSDCFTGHKDKPIEMNDWMDGQSMIGSAGEVCADEA